MAASTSLASISPTSASSASISSASTSPASTAYDAAWHVADIVYISIVGPVMLCAFTEWFLWLAAFCYCLVKAWSKAAHWSSKGLAVTIFIVFSLLRCAFLPVMLVTLPLPKHAQHFIPGNVSYYLQWFAFWTFAVLLVVPWLVCVYRVVVYPFGKKKQLPYDLDEKTAPKVVVVMPVYNEPIKSLWNALESVVSCDYPVACIHVFVSFDGDGVDELYLQMVERLGIPLVLKEYARSIDVEYRGARITLSRFPHGGKRHCQKATYRLINKIYKRYLQRNDDLFILFIDSDCILDELCIQNFMYEMELKPGLKTINKKTTNDKASERAVTISTATSGSIPVSIPVSKTAMLAMTGIITSSTGKNSFITLLQDMEYIHGQMYERSVESGCGAVTCLPGALTILRFSAFRNMAKYYFSDKAEQCEDIFDYGKMHLGEDRWLTHLFMVGARERYQIQMCSSAFCKTEAVQSFRSLLKQRRRWFLGFITNEVCMLTDARLWRKYPLLCIIRLMQNTIRTTALLFLVMVIAVASTTETFGHLPWQFIGISLGLNWIMMIYFAMRLGRWKAALYPLMFIMNPFMNWIYMVYGISTAGQRTWGGPRADAGKADVHHAPQEVIERAAAMGDDLNVVPETFKPALEARKHRAFRSELQPPSDAEGQFAPAELDEEGHYRPSSPVRRRSTDAEIGTRSPRDEDVGDLSESEGFSIHTPRVVR